MGFEDNPYYGKPNEKPLNEQRDKYINEAVRKIVPEQNLDEMQIKACLQGDIFTNAAMDLLCGSVLCELREKQGITENSPKETVEEFNQEFNKMAIKRIIKNHFVGFKEY